MTPIATTLAPTTPVEAASNEPTKMVETAIFAKNHYIKAFK
jgi:hypothetical protein